jgi:hypothetical protein
LTLRRTKPQPPRDLTVDTNLTCKPVVGVTSCRRETYIGYMVFSLFGVMDVRIRGPPPCWSLDSRAPSHHPPWSMPGRPVASSLAGRGVATGLPLRGQSGAQSSLGGGAGRSSRFLRPGWRWSAQSQLGSLGTPVRSARVRLARNVSRSRQRRVVVCRNRALPPSAHLTYCGTATYADLWDLGLSPSPAVSPAHRRGPRGR